MKLFILSVILLISITWNSAAAAVISNNTTVSSSQNVTIAPAPPPQTRITNGYTAQEGEVPYIVSMLFFGQNGGAWICGGTIIGHNWVLTAAHCTNGAKNVDIHYGSVNRHQSQYKHNVDRSNFIQVKYWPNINGNDLALIRTPYVAFTNRVNKIELPTYNDHRNNFANWWAKACGWGGYYDGSGLADNLQCVFLRIISNSECERTYGSLPYNIVCTATPNGQSTCGGDSGGPLVLHGYNRLIGITSFGAVGGCQKGNPAGFTRVSGHLQWIREHTGIYYQ